MIWILLVLFSGVAIILFDISRKSKTRNDVVFAFTLSVIWFIWFVAITLLVLFGKV
jgi:hypothetical protein